MVNLMQGLFLFAAKGCGCPTDSDTLAASV